MKDDVFEKGESSCIFDQDLISPTSKKEFENFKAQLRPGNKANRYAVEVDLTEATDVIIDNFDKFIE